MPSIALAQLAAAPRLEDNLEKSVKLIGEAARRGADLVLFPEINLSPFFPAQRGVDASQYLLSIDDSPIDRLREACREAKIFALPNVYLREGEHNYDASILIDCNGDILDRSTMVHVTQQPGFYEQDYYATSRDGFRVTETGIGRIGVVICFDRHYPESIRTCMHRGADIILVPTANLRDEPLDLFESEMRVAAFQNSVYIAMCNRVGMEGEVTWGGHSMLADPDGRVILRAGDAETLETADYNLELVRKKRRDNKFLPLYRAEAFELS